MLLCVSQSGKGIAWGVPREDVQGIKEQHAEEPYGFTGHKMILR